MALTARAAAAMVQCVRHPPQEECLMSRKPEKKKQKIEGLFVSVDLRDDTLVLKLDDGLSTTETEVAIEFAGHENIRELAQALERLRKAYEEDEAAEEEEADSDDEE